MSLNPSKTKELYIKFSKGNTSVPLLEMGGVTIDQVPEAKILGVTISNQLTWNTHVSNICAKASKRIYYLLQLKRAGIQQKDLIQIYKSVIRPVVEYASVAWHPGLPKYLSVDIENIQKRALKVIFPHQSYEEALNNSGLSSLHQRRKDSCIQYFSDMQKDHHKLHHLVPPKRNLRHNLRKTQFKIMVTYG